MGQGESKHKSGRERAKSPQAGGKNKQLDLDGKFLDDEEYLKMVKRRREKHAAKHEVVS